MSALADDDALDAQIERGFADALGDLVQVRGRTHEHAEIAGLGGVRGQRPADAGGMEYLAVADQAVDVRFGEKVRRRRYQQHLGAFHVQRVFHVHAGLVFDVFLEALQRVGERRSRQAEVVADLVDLDQDFVGVFLALTDRVHDFARGHGDLGGIDAVGAVHRAAAALRALMEVAVPLVQHVLGHVARADQLGEEFAGEGEMAAVDAAQQVLARHRHVFRVRGAEIIVTLVGAGAALHAGIEKHLQGA